jgi:hypothetical protein
MSIVMHLYVGEHPAGGDRAACGEMLISRVHSWTRNRGLADCEGCLRQARLMNWAAAGAYILQGRKLTRTFWNPEVYVSVIGQHGQVFKTTEFDEGDEAVVYTPTAGDLLARDWYIKE